MIVILNPAVLAVSLPWETTYDCPEWSQSDGSNTNCDGLVLGGGWTCQGIDEQITTAGNMAAGGGGKGQRHYQGPGQDTNSGGTRIYFTESSELWIRWYMRYPLGFSWASITYDKWLYIDQGQSDNVVPEFRGDEQVAVFAGGGSAYTGVSHPTAWSDIMDGNTGDGLWHLYEVHIKKDTNGNNGVAQLWIDEVLTVDGHNVDHGRSGGWDNIRIGSNQASPSSACMPVDYDDFAIRTTGYIGPVSGGSAVCGDSACNGNEDCSSCPDDCLNLGEVCCSGVVHAGDCCVNVDCTSPEICISATHTCQLPPQCEQDLDNDGYGVGASCLGSDCDDNNPSINPVAVEICGDGVDQDCSGSDQSCQTQDMVIFHDSIPQGANIHSGDAIAVSTANPYQGSSNLEITGQGSWSNCRIENLNIDLTSVDWQNSYLEFAVSSPITLDYIVVNLWGDVAHAIELNHAVTSGNYQTIQIDLVDFSQTQADFGVSITQFMIGSEFGSSTIYLDEIKIVSPSSYHPADTDESGCIELDEMIAYVNLWKTGQAAITDLMTVINLWKNGC